MNQRAGRCGWEVEVGEVEAEEECAKSFLEVCEFY